MTTTREENALRYWRKQKGLKQTELADLIGMHVTFISLWENGHSVPPRAVMERISEILEKPITMLFDL